MSICKSFKSFCIENTTYTFDHLVPAVVNLAGQGRDSSDLRVRISYCSHVFSQSCLATEVDFDFKDENGQKRRFCSNRYRISIDLQSVCQKLLSENADTWMSKDRNRVNNLAVIDGPLITGQHAIIIYYLFPSLVDGLDIEMVVKSAYCKFISFEKIHRKYKIIQQIKTCYYKRKTVP